MKKSAQYLRIKRTGGIFRIRDSYKTGYMNDTVWQVYGRHGGLDWNEVELVKPEEQEELGLNLPKLRPKSKEELEYGDCVVIGYVGLTSTGKATAMFKETKWSELVEQLCDLGVTKLCYTHEFVEVAEDDETKYY